jgi:4-amino-4-deoxy-L-arabinose transferase-like glycosyltransferase
MAARRTYSLWALAAIVGGVALTAIEVVGAVGYLFSQDQPSYLIAGGAVVTVVAAILPVLAARCWHHGRVILALLLWAAMVPALSVIFTAAVERTGGARDGANRDRQAIAQRIDLTRAAEAEAKVVADADELAAKAECSSGRRTKCLGLEERAEQSRQRLKSARDAVAQAGVIPTDPQARRLAAILPITEEAVALYQPLILPLAISALGLLLIAVGAHTPKRRKAKKRKGRRKRKALGSSLRRTGNIVPLRPRKSA